jgi:CRISPR-associated protein Cas6
MTDSNPWEWQDDELDQPLISDRALDMSFRLQGGQLRVDHAKALSEAITSRLPWLIDEPLAGVHLIHVAGSQNGWIRPESPDALLYLSRRTRLVIRIPTDRVADARALVGQTLDLDGQAIKLGEANERPIIMSEVLMARHVVSPEEREEDFLHRVAAVLRERRVRSKTLLPGRTLSLRTPVGQVQTRSLMVANLQAEDSLLLQEEGIGEGRHYGCGLFIPQKGIAKVGHN